MMSVFGVWKERLEPVEKTQALTMKTAPVRVKPGSLAMRRTALPAAQCNLLRSRKCHRLSASNREEEQRQRVRADRLVLWAEAVFPITLPVAPMQMQGKAPLVTQNIQSLCVTVTGSNLHQICCLKSHTLRTAFAFTSTSNGSQTTESKQMKWIHTVNPTLLRWLPHWLGIGGREERVEGRGGCGGGGGRGV